MDNLSIHVFYRLELRARPCGCGQVFPDQRPPRLERPGRRGCSRWGGTYHETTQALQLHRGLGFTGKETWRKLGENVRKTDGEKLWGKQIDGEKMHGKKWRFRTTHESLIPETS